jgi:negative regulator of flagellin synthesis FlgM
MMSAIESNVMVKPIKASNLSDTRDSNLTKCNEGVTKDLKQDTTNLLQLPYLKEALLNAPEVNKARVEYIRAELASNRYILLSLKIAAKMLQDC